MDRIINNEGVAICAILSALVLDVDDMKGAEKNGSYNNAETKVTIKNLDPYFFENGMDADAGYNVFEGTMDWENMVITIPMGQKMGYEDVYITGLEGLEDDDDYDDIYIDVLDYGQRLVIRNPFGPSADDGFWELYFDGIELLKQ